MSSQMETFVVLGDGIHYSTPILSPARRTTEVDLVRGVVQMMQGLSTSLFYWDPPSHKFCVAKVGVFVTHLSLSTLHNLLHQFIHAASCLQLVHVSLDRLKSETRMPTLAAFASCVSQWVKRLRDIALKEEVKMCNSSSGITPTLMGLSSSLSSLCTGAECLLQIVHGAIPQAYFEHNLSVSAAEMAVHVLDYLYNKLEEVCLIQGGEEEAYQMVLHIFVGSLLPYIEGFDSWLFEGMLDDPFQEMFFYAIKGISIDDSEFWEKSYQLRQVQSRKLDIEHTAPTSVIPLNQRKELGERDSISISSIVRGKELDNEELKLCPSFIKEIAKPIVSAGKSLQLIRHIPMASSLASSKSSGTEIDSFHHFNDDVDITRLEESITGLTLSEIFCISVSGLVGNGDHISRYLLRHNLCNLDNFTSLVSKMILEKKENGSCMSFQDDCCSENTWYKFLVDTLLVRKVFSLEATHNTGMDVPVSEAACGTGGIMDRSFCPENPVITVCRTLLHNCGDLWKTLNLSKNFYLPPLNDEIIQEAVFGSESAPSFAAKGTDYTFGFQFSRSEHLRSQDDIKLVEDLYPFPTILPSDQNDASMSELLPFQKNSTLPSRVLGWIQTTGLRTTLLPVVIVQECLVVYMKKQVDYIGRLILSKLMNEWRLMDELAVLRAIYLLGSGDLLQHFLTVIFHRLDRGETWDDDFELNTILQESIRNSADGMLLSAPDALIVTITKNHDVDDLPTTPTFSSAPHKSQPHSLGIDGLDSLKFTYKVSWPLELIANTEATKKYNQVMTFLLKVKRAKFVLDKARRWMWKGRGSVTNSNKHHWLVEQKLLHFVDAFHQYVMDRVYHSAWRELCEGMEVAGSLDEVIEVHAAYLLSIQRQCFVVPDKLWAMIASRINSILRLALDFYSVQQTLSNGGVASAMKARCEMEVDRIEKQFHDCIAFLLRVLSSKLNVGHFPHLADLVTRINYNYFYMSDSGNLMATSGTETLTSRLGKSFGGS